MHEEVNEKEKVEIDFEKTFIVASCYLQRSNNSPKTNLNSIRTRLGSKEKRRTV